jgi:tetratricopeptide (TPR) repeat protein
MGKDWALIQNSYRLIERSLNETEKHKTGIQSIVFNARKIFVKFSIFSPLFRSADKFYWDDLALALLLKGCCLRYMGSPLQAEECFLNLLKMEKQIVDDYYIIPYCVAELGFLYETLGKKDQAIVWLEAAKYVRS